METTLPAYVGEAFTKLGAQFDALMGEAWPVMLAIFAGFALMGMFKKVGRKAVS